MSTYVHTLGDSTLDNFKWMLDDESDATQAKLNSVEGQLQERLNHKGHSTYRVVSHAYDGFTTTSVLSGDHVGRVFSIQSNGFLSENKKTYLWDRGIDPASRSYFVQPLDQFKRSVNENPNATHYVVISVGGNDFRERLGNPLAMLKEIPHVHQRYLQILNEVKSLKDRDIRPILMFQYRLDVHHDRYEIYEVLKKVGLVFCAIHSISFLGIAASTMALVAGRIDRRLGLGALFVSSAFLYLSRLVVPLKVTKGILSREQVSMATLGGLLETFYKPILAQAKADRIPILDLPNTFNPNDSSLYIAQIEPSQKGSRLIAEGINQIIKRHDFNSKSMMYAKRDSSREFVANENPGFSGWSVTYP